MSRPAAWAAVAALGVAAAAWSAAVVRGEEEPVGNAHGDDQDAHERRPVPSQEEISRLPPDGGSEFNRLVFEGSPYLLQHARNPVDWYPWGPEAFGKARAEGKPVFLSIGYSTCHWCHVMERESFEDEEVAAVLNARFVPVKVDREERPDVDHIYMQVCLAMNGQGGWPLTVVMTSEGEPFFAGTYFPKRGAYGRPGLMDLLGRIAEVWETDRPRAVASAGDIARFVREQSAAAGGGAEPGIELLEAAHAQLSASFDARRGGFGHAPKFPSPHGLTFLLRRWRRTGDAAALRMVEETLAAMDRGGIHDHLGGGFARYSTDAEWLVPHFEKMLYDQGMLAIAYAEAFQATGKDAYARVVRDIVGYVQRDLGSPEGAYFSAEDADSEGLEGKFYVWRPEEVVSLLGERNGGLFCRFYDVTDGGNFHEPHGPAAHSILHPTATLEEFSRRERLDLAEVDRILTGGRRRLLDARSRRVRPGLDDKILADWNGLMIAALARAAQALGEPAYAGAAGRAADFILARMRDADGRLLHRYRAGQAGILGTLDDHAFLVWGLLELYEAGFDPRRLEQALWAAGEIEARFRDPAGGPYFMTGSDAETLLTRPREMHDGAIPSGNSVHATNLVRLARLTGDVAWEGRTRGLLRAASDAAGEAPHGHLHLLGAVDSSSGPSREVVIAGTRGAADTEALLAVVRGIYDPSRAVLLRPPGPEGDAIARIAPYTAGMGPVGGRAAAYVCANRACRAPVTDPAALAALLR